MRRKQLAGGREGEAQSHYQRWGQGWRPVPVSGRGPGPRMQVIPLASDPHLPIEVYFLSELNMAHVEDKEVPPVQCPQMWPGRGGPAGQYIFMVIAFCSHSLWVPDSVNQCFPNDCCTVLQNHAWVKIQSARWTRDQNVRGQKSLVRARAPHCS